MLKGFCILILWQRMNIFLYGMKILDWIISTETSIFSFLSVLSCTYFSLHITFSFLTVFYVSGILIWFKNMVWRYHSLDSVPIADLHGRWQRGGTIQKFTSMSLTNSSLISIILSVKIPLVMLSFMLLNILYILVKRLTDERPGWCTDPNLPPCAAYALSFFFLDAKLNFTNL